MAKIVAVIPARSGSKSVIDKNIRIMNGKPLIAYSIEIALLSKYIECVIVSTDNEKYAGISRGYGAEIPFIRPSDISQDTSLDIDVFKHYLDYMHKEGLEIPEILVHLRPTHPIRDVEDIDKMIEIILSNPDIDSIRSMSPVKQIPFKMWTFNENGLVSPVAICDIKEAYNAPRQILPQVYIQNACIDVIRKDTIIRKNSMTGDRIYGYKMNYDFDIDTEEDFNRVEQYQMLRNIIDEGRHAKVVCDIDGVIAQKTNDNNYYEATPNIGNISLINRLYENGNEVILFTARGYATKIDWEETTQKQMKQWGVKYSQLLFGKPDADFYIDDKLLDIELLQIYCNNHNKINK